MSKDLEKRLQEAEARLETVEKWCLGLPGKKLQAGPPYTGNDVTVIFESGSSLLNPPGQFVQLPDLSSRAFVRCGYVDDNGQYQNSGWQDWPYVVRNNVPGANGWMMFAGNIVPTGAWVEFNPGGIANALQLPFQRLVSVEFGTILPLEKQDGSGLLMPEPKSVCFGKSLGEPKDSEIEPEVIAKISMKNCRAPNHIDQEKLLPADTKAVFVSASWWQPVFEGPTRQTAIDWLTYHNTYARKSTGNLHLEYSERQLLQDFGIPEDAVNLCFAFGVLKYESTDEVGTPYPRGNARR